MSWHDWIEPGALSLALAVDAAVVTAALAAANARKRDLAAAATSFALFQAAMSGAGAGGGELVARVAAAWDHWIAFGLLAVVGGRMLFAGDDDEAPSADLSAAKLLALSVATSIDALAAGVGLPLLALPVWASVLAIGAGTGLACGAAAALGRSLGSRHGRLAERVGGVVLIAIGVRILATHLAGAGAPPATP